jgi:hypothetical protein
MIINNAPVNEAIVSNVGEIGEFRIRNSAKAFNILSSGLYANKIRAIIRELSCNAVDSHVAAKKADTPFDVHLPSQMEPWFSIRDYGTGLSHEQVTQIYTTYFESTKTESNEFIGALGLGSKSPFSYTDNFTVTAIKDGQRGIYSAFINESGVPSIAKMMSEATDEPAGVEVKFSVNEYWDFSKFRDEARQVYTHFKLRPVVVGDDTFEFRDVHYETKDIIPGVHHTDRSYSSTAVMGNIAYPIDVPNEEKNLGNLARLLNCGLEMEFGIGELDFQASREGLSYIPQTIESIKRKLEAVNAQLAVHIAEEADKISNLWERALFLEGKKNVALWQAAVEKYITDTNFKFFKLVPRYSPQLENFKLNVDTLANRYNIQIRAFNKHRGHNTVANCGTDYEYHPTLKDANGHALRINNWRFPVSNGVRFVINDTKTGASERARNHFRKFDHTRDLPHTLTVFVIEPVDKTKPMNTKALFRVLRNPPTVQIMNASELMEKERATSGGSKTGRNVTILKLEERGTGGYYRSQEYVWRDAGKADQFDSKHTYYYIPMKGYQMDSERFEDFSGNGLRDAMHQSGIKSLHVDVFGVRKTDIEFIKTQKNWVNIEEFIAKELTKVTPAQLKTLAMSMADRNRLVRYNADIAKLITDKNSPYYLAAMNVKDSEKLDIDQRSLNRLCEAFKVTIDVDTIKDAIIAEHTAVYNRYPLLNSLSGYAEAAHVAHYVNLVDQTTK